jgi:17beta-estradiol 17-dehydrogenase / very-long-chain 3-oxoacyl-CoA reductase
MIELIFFIFGACQVVELLMTLTNYIKPLFLSKEPKLTPGTWAVITACTDGIGKGFAESLAKRGLNIVQVGRNPVKLSECSEDLKKKYGVEVKNIVKDFSICHSDPIDFFQDIHNQTKGLDIEIIVNNVGTSRPGALSDLKNENLLNMLSLNLFPIVFLTRLYENDLKNKENSWIINLSSVAAHYSIKSQTIYSACKAFDLVFSEVLISEGKRVMALQPAYVDTPLTRHRKTRPLLITANQCSESALRTLGVVQVTSGHWKHVITILLIRSSASLISFMYFLRIF